MQRACALFIYFFRIIFLSCSSPLRFFICLFYTRSPQKRTLGCWTVVLFVTADGQCVRRAGTGRERMKEGHSITVLHTACSWRRRRILTPQTNPPLFIWLWQGHQLIVSLRLILCLSGCGNWREQRCSLQLWVSKKISLEQKIKEGDSALASSLISSSFHLSALLISRGNVFLV